MNRIDFLVLVSGWLSLIPNIPNASVFRSLRMLRPLRAITLLPGIKVLLFTLLRALPALGNVVIFLIFMMLIFSIMGVMLFTNSFEYRCRDTFYPPSTGETWGITQGANYLCGWKSCPQESALCASAFEYGAPLDPVDSPFFGYGLVKFQNVFWGMLVVFEILTLEGWTDIMYMLWNNVNPWYTGLYCYLVIFLGAFFMINLLLAVIADSFNKAELQIYQERQRVLEEKKKKKNMLLKAVQSIQTANCMQDPNKKEEGQMKAGQLDLSNIRDEPSEDQVSPMSKKNLFQSKNIDIAVVEEEEEEDEEADEPLNSFGAGNPFEEEGEEEFNEDSSDDSEDGESFEDSESDESELDTGQNSPKEKSESFRVQDLDHKEDMVVSDMGDFSPSSNIRTTKNGADVDVMEYLRRKAEEKEKRLLLEINLENFQEPGVADSIFDCKKRKRNSSTGDADAVKSVDSWEEVELGAPELQNDSEQNGILQSQLQEEEIMALHSLIEPKEEAKKKKKRRRKKKKRIQKEEPLDNFELNFEGNEMSQDGMSKSQLNSEKTRSLNSRSSNHRKSENINRLSLTKKPTMLSRGNSFDANKTIRSLKSLGSRQNSKNSRRATKSKTLLLDPEMNTSEFELPSDDDEKNGGNFKNGQDSRPSSDSSFCSICEREKLDQELLGQNEAQKANKPSEKTRGACPHKRKPQKEKLFKEKIKEKAEEIRKRIKRNFQKISGSETIQIPKHAKSNEFYELSYRIAYSPGFIFLSLAVIMFNSCVLALDHYPSSQFTLKLIFITSNVCNVFFTIELVLKMLGVGLNSFVRDILIVVMGYFEVIWLSSSKNSKQSGSAVSAFRSFRILRIFKLASASTTIKSLLKKMYHTFRDLTNFSVLLFLFILVMALLGMELFAYRVRFWKETREPYDNNLEDPDAFTLTGSQRINFDSLGNSLVATFVFLTREKWGSITREMIRTAGLTISLVFVIPCIVIGNYILLNLFLAILITNFNKKESEDSLVNSEEVKRIRLFYQKINEKLNEIGNILSMRSVLEEKWGPAILESEFEKKKNEAREELSQLDPVNPLFPYHVRPPSKVIQKRVSSLKNKEELLKSASGYLDLSSAKQDPFEIIYKQDYGRMKLPEGYAFYFMGPNNKLRRFLLKIVVHPFYELALTLVIVVSGVILALDLPLLDPSHPMKFPLKVMDYFVNSVFVAEFIVKVLCYGLIFNGQKSYFRSGWNILDFLTVLVFIISQFSLNISVSNAQIFRSIRILRPLRIINFSEELQIVINCLLKSLKGVISVVLISMIFFFTFGIFGTNIFKGAFYSCDTSNIPTELQSLIQTKWDCLDYGGDWVNADQNFDQIFKSMALLFQLSTCEGWVELMFFGTDAVGHDYVPQEKYNQLWALYFVLFLIVSTFFILNLFAGIVCESFNRERDNLREYSFLTPEQAMWVDIQIYLIHKKPEKEHNCPKNAFRAKAYKIVKHKWFTLLVFTSIAANTIIMMCYHSRQSESQGNLLNYLNIGLVSVFTIEAVLFIMATGKEYFKDNWKRFDFFVVSMSILVAISFKAENDRFENGVLILRSLRVVSFIRLLKENKKVKIIIDTFLMSIPSLVNVGALLLLIIYAFSILGIGLFPYVKYGKGINANSNFHHFGMAFMTLFRVATGEDWYLIQGDCLRFIRPNNICFEINSWEEYQQYGMMGCGISLSYLYFAVFQIAFTFVLLNLFVAIVIEAYLRINAIEKYDIKPEEYQSFNKEWAQADPAGQSLISPNELMPFLKKIKQPIGLPPMIFESKRAMIQLANRLQIPLYYILSTKETKFFYYDVLLALVYNSLNTMPNYNEKLYPEIKLNIHMMIEKARVRQMVAIRDMCRTPYQFGHLIAGERIKEIMKAIKTRRNVAPKGNQSELKLQKSDLGQISEFLENETQMKKSFFNEKHEKMEISSDKLISDAVHHNQDEGNLYIDLSENDGNQEAEDIPQINKASFLKEEGHFEVNVEENSEHIDNSRMGLLNNSTSADSKFIEPPLISRIFKEKAFIVRDPEEFDSIPNVIVYEDDQKKKKTQNQKTNYAKYLMGKDKEGPDDIPIIEDLEAASHAGLDGSESEEDQETWAETAKQKWNTTQRTNMMRGNSNKTIDAQKIKKQPSSKGNLESVGSLD